MVVVTGANGFLGSYVVCALLQKGYEVKALKRASSGMSEFNDIAAWELGADKQHLLQKLTWLEADIMDIQDLDMAFAGAEFVFHCAAKVSFKGNSHELTRINAEGTANVVNACLKAGVKKLVYASSTASLGRTDSKDLITEETQWAEDDNNTAYACSKHLAELEVWRGIEEGLDAVIVNPGIILGAGKWDKGSCKLFDNVNKGFRFYTKGVNGFVGASDVARTMIGLAENGIVGERFLLVSENISYQDLFSMMAKCMGTKPPAIEIKPGYKKWLKWPLRLYRLLNPNATITTETLNTSVKEHRYSNDKIRKAGFLFTPIAKVVEEACMRYPKS